MIWWWGALSRRCLVRLSSSICIGSVTRSGMLHGRLQGISSAGREALLYRSPQRGESDECVLLSRYAVPSMQSSELSVPLLVSARINSWKWGMLLASNPAALGGVESFGALPCRCPSARQCCPVWCGDAWQQVSPFLKCRSRRTAPPRELRHRWFAVRADDQTDHQAPCGSFDPDLGRLDRNYEHTLKGRCLPGDRRFLEHCWRGLDFNGGRLIEEGQARNSCLCSFDVAGFKAAGLGCTLRVSSPAFFGGLAPAKKGRLLGASALLGWSRAG
jgi:hypothetical protein